jgi:predicted dehydrogenase
MADGAFSMKACRLAFVSTAHIHTSGFIDGILAATDGRCVHAVWDDQAMRGRRHAERARAQFYPELGAFLADPAIDGFLICAENIRHLPLLRQVVPLGKPVFCEKPLVTGVEDATRLRSLLHGGAAPLVCGYFHPFEGMMRAVATLLAQGAFGRVTRTRCRISHAAAYARSFDHLDVGWLAEPALSGGGAFLDLGTHSVHLLRTLFGPVTNAWATIRNESGAYPACDDFGLAHLLFSSGVLGTVEAAWTQTGGISGLEIVGEKLSLWHTGETYVLGAFGEAPTPLVAAPDLPARVDRLVAVIRGEISEASLMAELDAAIDAVAIVEACYESARSGRWTPVAPVSHSAFTPA